MYIKLTRRGKPLWINTGNVVYVTTQDDRTIKKEVTMVYFVTGSIRVDESIDEVVELLQPPTETPQLQDQGPQG